MLDLLIHDAAIVTVDPHDTVIERGSILVDGGRLVAVRPTQPDDAALPARVTLDGTGRVALPGLVNAHVHTGQSLLLGRFSQFSGLEVMLESAALGHALDQARAAADPLLDRWTDASWRLGVLNMIRGGITLFNNMGRSTPAGAAVVGQAGLRAVLGPTLGDELLGEDSTAQLARARAFIEEFHGAYDGRIRAAVCPHGDLYTSRPPSTRMLPRSITVSCGSTVTMTAS
jgi:5-methylthioadenosine/S-adenosylhomocysteine deaminase